MGIREEPIWDGNGGELDPKKAPQRDLLVALHVKMDQVVIPALRDLQDWRREQENGDLTRGQEAAIRGLWQEDQDASTNRRALKAPVWALGISLLALVCSAILTVAALSGGGAL